MSRLTETPLLVAPLANEGHAVTTGTLAWENGDWVEFIAATSADDTAVAGFSLQDRTANTWSGAQIEVEVGIGAEGEEAPIGHIRLSAPSSGNGGPTEYLLPYPISGIAAGTRVSLRLRYNNTAVTWSCTLLYYEDLDTDQAVPYQVGTLTSFPSGSSSLNLVPPGVAWNNSPWVEFDDAVGEPTYIIGLALSTPVISADQEIEIGTGEAASEAALTLFRTGTYFGGGRLYQINLPGMLPIPTGERLVARIRQTGTATEPVPVAFLAYTGPLTSATLIITKVTSPPGSPQEFDFSTPGLTPDTFTLTDGQSQIFTDIEPGTYSVEEIDVPAGWTLTSVVVSNGDDPDAITIGPGETVTVTFTNTQGTTLIVQKVTDPSDATQEFAFTIGPGLEPSAFLLQGGEQQVYTDVPEGTYGVEETVPDGWTLTSVVVSNGDPPDAIEIGPGDAVTVVFTNVQDEPPVCPGLLGAPLQDGLVLPDPTSEDE